MKALISWPNESLQATLVFAFLFFSRPARLNFFVGPIRFREETCCKATDRCGVHCTPSPVLLPLIKIAQLGQRLLKET